MGGGGVGTTEAPTLAGWELVFRQTVPYTFGADEWALNSGDPLDENFAILDQLDSFRDNGSFTLMLRWPADGLRDQVWAQGSNPVTTPGHVTGYQPIDVPYTGQDWGGLRRSVVGTLMDGTNEISFWYAIGAQYLSRDGLIPGPATNNSAGIFVSQVELWAKAATTASPTPSPTASPTASPTPSPTPRPAAVSPEADADPGELGAGAVNQLPTSAPTASATPSPTPNSAPAPTEAPTLAGWELVFRQTVPYTFGADEWTLNSGDSLDENFAILDRLESFRDNGSFTLMLRWPADGLRDQVWAQGSNPVTTPGHVTGYQPIDVPYTGQDWGGLRRSVVGTLMDGTNEISFWYALGTQYLSRDGFIPGPATNNSAGIFVSQVELWAKVPTPGRPTPAPTDATTTTAEAHETGTAGADQVVHDVAGGSTPGMPAGESSTTTTGRYIAHEVPPTFGNHGDAPGPGSDFDASTSWSSTTTPRSQEAEQPVAEANHAVQDAQQPVAEANHAIQEAPTVDAPPQVVVPGTATAKGDPHLVNVKGERFDINEPGSYTLLRMPASGAARASIRLQAMVERDKLDPCSFLITEAEVSGTWFAGTGSLTVRAMRRRHPSPGTDGSTGRARRRSRPRDVPTDVRARISEGEEAQPFGIQRGPHGASVPLWEFAGVEGGGGENVSVRAVLTSKRPGGGRDDAHSAAGFFKVSANGMVIKIIQKRPGWGFLNIEIAHLDRLRTLDVGGLLGFGDHPSQPPAAECLARRTGRRKRWRREAGAEQASLGLSHQRLSPIGGAPADEPRALGLGEDYRGERSLGSYASGLLE